MINEKMAFEDFIKLVSNRRIYIYGAGFNAKKFMYGMKCIGLKDNISNFVVTEKKENGYIDNIPVVCIEDTDIRKDEIVCIAVHNSLLPEIEEKLLTKGVVSYIWIVPYVDSMIYGDAIETNVLKRVDSIISATPIYGFAIKYLAIESFRGENELGKNIYIKACMFDGTSRNVAERRYYNYKDFFEKSENGLIKNLPQIHLTSNDILFDGSHRMMLFYYNDIKYVSCDIYNVKDFPVLREFSKASIYKNDYEARSIFTKMEWELIEKTDCLIRN